MTGIAPSHRPARRTAQRAASTLSGALLLVAGLVLPNLAAAVVNIDNLADFDFGTWSANDGTAVARQDFCVQSDFFFGFFVVDWAARLDDLSGASDTRFRIENGDGSDSLIVDVRFVDLQTGIGETLSPGVATGADQTGDRSNCPRGLNGRLEIRIDATQLASGLAGRYEGDFRFSAEQFGADSDDFSIRIRIPDLMQVSDLDDIDLGTFGGSGDLVGSDRICVYRNDASTRYEVEARGQGAGSDFVLQQGPESLPFEVDYDDGSGYTTLAAGGGLPAVGAANDSLSCGGLGSASVRVRVREADLQTAAAGAYAGTLTLTVAPI